MMRGLLLLAFAAPAMAHQVPLYQCTFQPGGVEVMLGYDEHTLTFPLHLKDGPVALTGGRTDSGEAFAGEADGTAYALTISDGVAELQVAGEVLAGRCERPG